MRSWSLSIALLLVFSSFTLWACDKNGSSHSSVAPSKGKEAAQALAAADPKTKAVEKKQGPDWKAAFKHQVRYDAKRKAVVVDVEIADGYHAYTVGETVGKPLELTVDEAKGHALDGDIVYPKGITKDLPIGKSVIVEGKAEIVAKVKPTAKEAKQAGGKFRYQVCTNEACDRPRTVAWDVSVSGTKEEKGEG